MAEVVNRRREDKHKADEEENAEDDVRDHSGEARVICVIVTSGSQQRSELSWHVRHGHVYFLIY